MKLKTLYLIGFIYLLIGVLFSIIDIFYASNAYLIAYGIISIVISVVVQIMSTLNGKTNKYLKFLLYFSIISFVIFIISFFEDYEKFYKIFLMSLCASFIASLVEYIYISIKDNIKKNKNEKIEREKLINEVANSLKEVEEVKDRNQNK